MIGGQTRDDNGPLGIAGWLYADLFLALVIVGLASTWVLSSDSTSAETTLVETTTTTTVPSEVQFQLSCRESFVPPSLLTRDAGLPQRLSTWISEEIARRGWSSDSAKPGLVLVYSGYDAEGEGRISEANLRAKDLAGYLKANVPELSGVDLREGASTNQKVNGIEQRIGGEGSFGLIMYFVYQGAPLDEVCSEETP
jgi:hypothetical protein